MNAIENNSLSYVMLKAYKHQYGECESAIKYFPD